MSPAKETGVFRYGGDDYTRQDLLAMNEVCLRALFRERVHHTIEVEIYPILTGKKKMPPTFGNQANLLLQVWRDRGLPETDDDLVWCLRYIDLANQLRAGKDVVIEEALPEPFTEDEMAVVNKLLWARRSVRDWVSGRPVPREMIDQILDAGRAAPTGCNLEVVRFVVISDPEEAKLVWSDIPTPADSCVLIVICYDSRIYRTVGHDLGVAHNQLYDCAAVMDHMGLMAHALGLGSVWLTCTEKTAATFQKKYGLPDYIKQAAHLAVGWTAVGSIKSGRMPLEEMVIEGPNPVLK